MQSIEVFYRLLINFIKDYNTCSNCDNCLTPKTFAVLSSLADLNSTSLGKEEKDKDLDYFYSQLWENKVYKGGVVFDWSLLAVWETEIKVENLFSNKKLNKFYNLQIGILDRYNMNSLKSSQGCEGRTIDEIYNDTQMVMEQLVDYLKKSRYNSLDELEYLPENTSANQFNRMLESNNRESSFYKFDPTRERAISSAAIYGTFLNLVIEVNSCAEFPECDGR